jgi:hypothetical protein
MSIFDKSNTISFGPQMPHPGEHRPEEAMFKDRRVPRGECFGLSWSRDTRAIGYHIFRSLSVRHVRDRSMHSLWGGTYADAVQHFTVGPEVDKIVDNYDLRGADMMYYWVLSQDRDGVLREVERLQTHIADEPFRRQQHVLLEDARTREVREHNAAADAAARAPSAPSPPQASPAAAAPPVAAHRPAPAPILPQRPLRPVTFIPYKAPQIFQILERDGSQQYELYVGPQMPPAEISDAMWDGALMPGNPMRCYHLPGNLEGFGDRIHAPGEDVFLCLFGVREDGSRFQPGLGIPASPPSIFAELT